MNLGYVRLYRNLINSQIFQNEKLLKIFIWCLLKATYKERTQIVGRTSIELKEGQFIFGRNKAALELDMPPSTLWDYIKLLKKMKTISIKSNNKYSIVTIEKWEIYQSKDLNYDKESNYKIDNKSTSNGQQIDTNNKEYKVYNDKNKEIYNRVITRLNEKANKNYKSDTKRTMNYIEARLQEGFTEEDFYKVIDTKCNEWLNNDTMNQYLRPETLFGSKFEKYLNQNINGYISTDTYTNNNKKINYVNRTSYVVDELEVRRQEHGLI